VAEALNSSPSVQQALDRTLELVTDLLGLQTGWVWLVDSETAHIYSAAARNLPPYLQKPVHMTGSWCLCIEEFRNGSLTPRNVDVMECRRLRPAVRARQTDLTHGLAHHASVPLSFQDKPLGIMNITAPAMRRLTKEELRLLGTIGLQVGVAIERARLAEESAILARADARTRLTPRANRRRVSAMLGAGPIWLRCCRVAPCHVTICNLDRCEEEHSCLCVCSRSQRCSCSRVRTDRSVCATPASCFGDIRARMSVGFCRLGLEEKSP